MPTERYAVEYNMNHRNRGQALIFNHEHFDIPNLKSRAGTNVDCDNLREALEYLDFDVLVYKDCKYSKILHYIEKAASKDHRDNDCILIAVMSHGNNGIIYAKDVHYQLDSISQYFTPQNCATLAGKPKIFLIQACQGSRYDPGVMLQATQTDSPPYGMDYKIPLHADYLYAYSTIPGFYAWRNATNGSWFIQSLVKEIKENGKNLDMLTLLTFVNRRVAVDFESCVPDSPIMHQQKQIPCVTTMLTRILRFSDKK
ncbi:caspase-like [Teleopsis dalmanni]|uniref:caspase-like n=1 Tax=Teleopsis dalmanni TaxID=139649 RepID=UPI0018CE2F94|nr:caspase-like [Teleopsis dalmanni]